MSEIAHRGAHHITYADEYERGETEVTGWVGWVGFAGFVMILSGIFQGIAGLVALFHDTFYAASTNQMLVLTNIHTWGWVNLIVGAIVLLAGLALFSGSTWARVLAVLFAMGSAIVNMVAIPLYPVWAILCIALSVLVMYAVIAHGGELKEE